MTAKKKLFATKSQEGDNIKNLLVFLVTPSLSGYLFGLGNYNFMLTTVIPFCILRKTVIAPKVIKLENKRKKGKRKRDYKMRGRFWISEGENTFIGHGRVVLLEKIKDCGSITKAAKSMGMSYRNAWELVESMNKHGRTAVVVTVTGGKGGGGARLTREGEKWITLFWELKKEMKDYMRSKEDLLKF